MQSRIPYLTILIVLCIAAGAAGCSAPAATTATAPATPAPANTASSAATSAPDLVPVPTDALPAGYEVTIDVGEKDYLAKIPVTFQGGMGQIHVTRIDVRLTKSDGGTIDKVLTNNKGDSVDLDGTKQTDRVEVWVSMNNGQRYKTNDVLSPYRTRG